LVFRHAILLHAAVFRHAVFAHVVGEGRRHAEGNGIAKRRNMWWYRGEAKVGSVLVAEAQLGACLAEN
jgi:hypothetical protein